MKMNLRTKFTIVLIGFAMAAVPVAFSVRADHDDATTYRARLSGFGEVPPKLVDGSGKFTGTLSEDRTRWALAPTPLICV